MLAAVLVPGADAWRVLSCVQKIQSLESNMADGTQDGEALQEELAKLVHARNSLPHSYGLMPLLMRLRRECSAC